MPERSLQDTHIFSVKHITALYLGTLNSTSGPRLGAILNSEITNKKCENHGTKYATEKTLVYSMRAETRRQSVALFFTLFECAHQASQKFPCSIHVSD